MPGAPGIDVFPGPRRGEGGAHSRAQYRLRINLQKKGNKSQNTGTGVRENRIDSRKLVSTVKIDFPFIIHIPFLLQEKKNARVCVCDAFRSLFALSFTSLRFHLALLTSIKKLRVLSYLRV